MSKQDWRKTARTLREAIALRPDEPSTYMNLGGVLANSGLGVEAAQRFLQAKELEPVGSELWAGATAGAFDMLGWRKECGEVAKPEWWNDEGLKALSARVVRAAPNDAGANRMRAEVLSGVCRGAWEVGRRSAVELKEAATLYERTAAPHNGQGQLSPMKKADLARCADRCRSRAAAIEVLEAMVASWPSGA